MRSVSGELVLPPNAPSAVAALVLIELRDVSIQDAPSRVVAEQRLSRVRIAPGKVIAFRLKVPEAPGPTSLSLRAHVSLYGSTAVVAGDLLTTASHPVPLAGDVESVRVPLQVI